MLSREHLMLHRENRISDAEHKLEGCQELTFERCR